MKTPTIYLKNLVYDTIELYDYIQIANSRDDLFDSIIYEGELRSGVCKLCTLAMGDFHFVQLSALIESIDPRELVVSRCLPNFTNGILFLNDEKVVGWLSICFTCNYLLWPVRELGSADVKFYKGIRELFATYNCNFSLEP